MGSNDENVSEFEEDFLKPGTPNGGSAFAAAIFAACFVAATVSSAEQPTLLNPQAQGFGPASEPGPFGINWVLETPQAGSGEIIQAGGGVLCLKLKGDANDLFVLRPAEPIPVPERTQRINIYTCLDQIPYLRFQWLIEGADGVERPFQADLGAGIHWRKTSSVWVGGLRNSFPGIGNAAPGGGPMGPSAITGLRVILADKTNGQCFLRDAEADTVDYLNHVRWQMYLGPEDVTGWSNLRGLNPYGPGKTQIPVDLVIQEPGEYHLGWSVRDVYQGPVVMAGSRDLVWTRPGLEQAYGERVELDLKRTGTYWIELRAWRPDGTLAGERSVRVAVVRGESGTPDPVNWRGLPRLNDARDVGILRLDTGQENHIYPAQDEVALLARIVPHGERALPDGAELRMVVRKNLRIDALPGQVLDEQVFPIETAAGPLDLQWPWKVKDKGDAYFLIAELVNGEQVLDRRKLKFAVRDVQGAERKTPMRQPVLSDFADGGKRLMTTGDNGTWTDPAWGPFLEVYDKACTGWKEVGLTGIKMLLQPWEIAPLPGFLRTLNIDERLTIARKHGLTAVLAPTPTNHRWDPEWLPWACQEDFQGLTQWRQEIWNSEYYPDHSDPVYRDFVRRNLTDVYSHIRNDMDVVAWNYQTDIFFVDHGGGLAGYSVSSQASFRRFLREKLKLSLSQVNERYGSEYASWGDVMIPMPELDREAWNKTNYARDVMAFKNEVVREFYMDLFTRTLRAEGDTRPTSFYHPYWGIDEDYYSREVFASGGYASTGHGDTPVKCVHYADRAFLNNSIWQAEYQAIVPGPKQGKWDADTIVAGMLLFGGASMHLNMFYNVLHPQHQTPTVSAGLERQRIWSGVLAEMATAVIPKINFAGYEDESLYSLFRYRAQVPNHMLRDYYPQESWDDRTCLILTNPEISPEGLRKVKAFVKRGGRLVFLDPAAASRFTGESGDPTGLLSFLGWGGTVETRDPGQDEVEATSEQTLFVREKILRLLGRPPEQVEIPAGAKVEARFQTGQPAVVRFSHGNGEVLVFVRPLNVAYYMTRADPLFIDDLLTWTGSKRWVQVHPNTGEYVTNYLCSGETRYLALHREVPEKQHGFLWWAKTDMKSSPEPVKTRLSAFHLPAGRYRVTRLGPEGAEPGEMTREQLEAGIETEIGWAQLIVWRLDPIQR